MKTTLRTEELAQLILAICIFSYTGVSWWWFIGLFFLPDIGMLGYIINSKMGAITYNVLHHKGIAIVLLLFGYFYDVSGLVTSGIILFGHAAFDRMLGYGLKFEDSFHNTHLGRIGKE